MAFLVSLPASGGCRQCLAFLGSGMLPSTLCLYLHGLLPWVSFRLLLCSLIRTLVIGFKVHCHLG